MGISWWGSGGLLCRIDSQATFRESPKGLRCPLWAFPTKGFPQQILGKGAFVGVSLGAAGLCQGQCQLLGAVGVVHR